MKLNDVVGADATDMYSEIVGANANRMNVNSTDNDNLDDCNILCQHLHKYHLNFLDVLEPVDQPSVNDFDDEFTQYAWDLLQKSIKSIKRLKKGYADNNTKRYDTGREMRLALGRAKKAVWIAKGKLIGKQIDFAQLNEIEKLSRNSLLI
jgi:hypothetical protein